MSKIDWPEQGIDGRWICPTCDREPRWEYFPVAEFILEPSEDFVWTLACSHSDPFGEVHAPCDIM